NSQPSNAWDEVYSAKRPKITRPDFLIAQTIFREFHCGRSGKPLSQSEIRKFLFRRELPRPAQTSRQRVPPARCSPSVPLGPSRQIYSVRQKCNGSYCG